MRAVILGTVIVMGLVPTASHADDVSVARQVLAKYERIRDALANDTGAPIAAHARDITRLTRSSRATHLQRAGTAAQQLSRVSATDLVALRRAFGELSRPLVELLDATPQLSGYHVFYCPMTQGYQRWIQRTETIENPYMGQRMLMCGAPVED